MYPPAELTLSCATCDVRITGTPTFDAELPFCCAGCLAGRACTCPDPVQGGVRVRHCRDVADPEPPWRMAKVPRDLALSRR